MTAESSTATASGSVVRFEHKVFSSMAEAYFRLSEQDPDLPVMMVPFAENNVALPFDGLRKEFGIEKDSADDKMLELVAEGLNFVVLLRPGDPIPAELLTGAPSAEISPDHRQIAYHRLTMQLVTWMTGDEALITDRDQLAQIAEDPGTKKRVNEALGEAAKGLGLPTEEKERVLELMGRLADDLAAIEALRDRFQRIEAMDRKIQDLRGVIKSHQIMIELLDPVARLMTTAAKQFRNEFEEIDAQTGEIIALLKNIDSQLVYIREKRNDLHKRLMAWDEILDAWDKAKIEDSEPTLKLLRETYRFLAPRFMAVDEWALVTQAQAARTEMNMRQSEENHGLAKTEVSW